jgi:carboxypeptidase C (cathepsin A)
MEIRDCRPFLRRLPLAVVLVKTLPVPCYSHAPGLAGEPQSQPSSMVPQSRVASGSDATVRSSPAALALLLCLLASAPPAAEAAPASHEITELPGWKGPLPSKAYAGYIDAGTDTQDGTTYKMHEHYMFIEAEHNPEEAPVLLWSNGGPGASSFFGLFVELGPFMLDGASLATAEFNETGVPTLWYNQYGWTQAANLLIINSPPPVGYSYCDPAGPAGNGSSCGAWNDTRTATHNYEFLVNWFDAFPEYKERELYLSGESYAGANQTNACRKITI